MALILGRTHSAVAPGTSAALALVCLRTSIGIIASRPIRFIGIRTRTCRRIAGAGDMALILCRTNDVITPRARPALALIRLRTGIGIITGRAIGFRRIRAPAGCRIA